MRPRRAIVAIAVSGLLLVSAACGSTARRPSTNALNDDAITVASFDFPESEVLASVYAQAMRAGGYRVRLALNLGSREFVEPALARGLVEFLPEYAGTALQFLSRNGSSPSADPAVNHRRLVQVLQHTDIAALAPAPAQDANGFAVTLETAGRYNLRSLSDLRPIASKLTFGGPPECPVRPFCGQGLRDTYHLNMKKFLPTDAGGPLTLQALDTGLVDVALIFTTDPRLSNGSLLQLRDDRRLQPAESVTPLVHRAVLHRWGSKLVRVVDAVSARLTTEELRALNRQVIIDQRKPSEVAAQWLKSEGIR